MMFLLSTLCRDLSQLFFLGARVLFFHGYNHYPQGFQNPKTLSVTVSILNLCNCKTLPLTFVLHHFVPHVQSYLLFHVSLDFLFYITVSYEANCIYLGINFRILEVFLKLLKFPGSFNGKEFKYRNLHCSSMKIYTKIFVQNQRIPLLQQEA